MMSLACEERGELKRAEALYEEARKGGHVGASYNPCLPIERRGLAWVDRTSNFPAVGGPVLIHGLVQAAQLNSVLSMAVPLHQCNR